MRDTARGASGGGRAKERGGEKEGEEERGRKKSPSITHVRASKTWKTARLITLLHSLSCLRLYARQSGEEPSLGPPPRTNAAPQTYPPFLAFYSTIPPLSPVFFAFHGTNKDRFTSASCDTRRHFLPRHRGPYTMLNYTREYKWQFERSISISGRQLKGKFIRFNRSIKMIEIIFD